LASESGSNKGKIFRWLAMGTEAPIMVFIGAFLGYELGRRLGFPYDYVGLTLGAFVGFAASILALLKGLGALKGKGEGKGKGKEKERGFQAWLGSLRL